LRQATHPTGVIAVMDIGNDADDLVGHGNGGARSMTTTILVNNGKCARRRTPA
jgi:hypothetical protein